MASVCESHLIKKRRLARSSYLDSDYSMPRITMVRAYNQLDTQRRKSDYPRLEQLPSLLIIGYVDTNLSADWLKKDLSARHPLGDKVKSDEKFPF